MKSQIEHQFAQLSRIELTLIEHDDRISKNQNATTVNAAGTQKNAGQMAGFEQRLGLLELDQETNSSAGLVSTNTGMKEAHAKTIRTEEIKIAAAEEEIKTSEIESNAKHKSLTRDYGHNCKSLQTAHTTLLQRCQRIIENSKSRINEENAAFRSNAVTFSQAEN